MSVVSLLRRLVGRVGLSQDRDAAGHLDDGMLVYAIGDIHGELGLLRRMIDAIARDAEHHGGAGTNPHLVFLGDYVDRGIDSRGVVELLSRTPPAGFLCTFLRGNHEVAMLDFLENPVPGNIWLDFGGLETLASYGVRASSGARDPDRLRALRDRLSDALPADHLDFLTGLRSSLIIGGYVFVHAGLRPGRAMEFQTDKDLLWIREPFLSSPRNHGRVVVHGHTISDQPELRDNRIGLDTGAYATGVLSAAALSGNERRILQVRAGG